MVSGLLQLDIDVLLIICEELRPNRHLRPLASSCKYLRAIAAPVLFSGCSIKIARLVRFGELLPTCLWPIVRSLLFIGLLRAAPHASHKFELAAIQLSDALARMPNLRVITTDGNYRGLSRTLTQAMLSTPQLREFNAEGAFDFPFDNPDTPIFDGVARLTHFHYDRPIYESRDYPYNEDGDARLVSIIASQAHQSMESLVIPSATAHLSTMLHSPFIWPRLRVLSLRGERCILPGPLASVFRGMPALTSLVLELAQNLEHQAIWPKGLDISPFPWPQLETLVVSYPHPDDQLYRHLPRGLRRLSLCCWPRHYHHPIQYNRFTLMTRNWHSPILKSSEMLRILQQCDFTELQQLDVEFIADKEDMTLLGLVSSSFPRLTSLHLHRYRDRSSGVVDVPVVDIANTLASLQELRVLFAHLDFKDAPHPYAIHKLGGAGEEHEPLYRALNDAGNTFARSLAPSVRHICLLFRVQWINKWLPYRIGREGVGGAVAAYDASIEEIDGFPMEDKAGPPFFPRHRNRISII